MAVVWTFADGYETTLSAGISASATTFAPTSTTGAPSANPTLAQPTQFAIVLQSAAYPTSGTREVVTVTDSRTGTWTCSATANAYSTGDKVAGVVSSTALKTTQTQYVIARTSDGTAINSGTTGTTLTNDGVLALALGVSEVWFFQAWLLVLTANVTMDVKLGFTGPAGASMVWGFGGAAGAAVAGYGAWATSGGASAGMNGIGGTVSVGGVNSVTSGILLAGTVTNSTTAGTLNLQVAQNTSDAGNLTMKAGSLLLAWRIA